MTEATRGSEIILIGPVGAGKTTLAELLAKTLGQGFDLNAHFVKQPSNVSLAKHVVYTAGKTPGETRDEILSLVRPDRP